MLTHNTRDVPTAQRVDFSLFDEGSRGLGRELSGWKEKENCLIYLRVGVGDETTARVAGELDIFGLEEIICLHNRV